MDLAAAVLLMLTHVGVTLLACLTFLYALSLAVSAVAWVFGIRPRQRP